MRTIFYVLMVLAPGACGGSDSKPPSCQQALDHYYAAGCTYVDETTNPPTPIPEGQIVTFCQNAAIQAPKTCQDELDTWLVCNDAVPARASSNADCDCSVEYMALLRCR